MTKERPGDDGAVLPGLGPRSGVPKLSHSIDWAALVLDDVKGFVLSRVDGRTTLGEIVLLTPFPESQTAAILVELFVRGVIDIPGAPRPLRPSLPGDAAPPDPAPGSPDFGKAPTIPPAPLSPVAEAPSVSAAGNNEPGSADPGARPPGRILLKRAPSNTDDNGELTAEARQRFDELYQLTGDEQSPASAARLLGVPVDADRKTIKRAYFNLSKELHPDRYFRKNVGDYGKKLLSLFNAVKQAYETLDAQARK